MRYDPEKQSQKHKKYYKPIKRAERYQEDKEKKRKREVEKHEASALEEKKKKKEREAKNLNSREVGKKRRYFGQAKEIVCWEQLELSVLNRETIDTLKNQISQLYTKLEGKIDRTVDFVDEKGFNKLTENTSKKIDEIWNQMNSKINRNWEKLGESMDLAFKDIAREHGGYEIDPSFKFQTISHLI